MGNFFGLPERLKQERERLGLSQTAFGRIGDVSKNSQMAYEQGKASPDVQYLSLIANAGVDVGFLFSGMRSVANPGMKPEELRSFNSVVDSFWQLSDSGREQAKGILGAMVHREFEANGSTRGIRRMAPASVPTGSVPPAASIDMTLLATCIAGVEEGLRDSGRVMDPEKKAQLVSMLYDLHQAAESPPQKATILQFIKRAA